MFPKILTMDGFRVAQIDHVELYVPDRYAAAAWYARTLGLTVIPEFEPWASDPRGPLMIGTAESGTKLALFAGESGGRRRDDRGFHRVAFRVGAETFREFLVHVRTNPVLDDQGEELRELRPEVHVVIPAADGEALASVYREGEVVRREDVDGSIDLVVRLPVAVLGRLQRREGVNVFMDA